jgi:Rod binding domain-containing protein
MTLDPVAASTSATTDTTTSKPASDVRLQKAAKDFEALVLAQMLKSMREAAGGGWMGSGSDSAGSQAMSLAEEQFAAALAARGGLGLVNVVVKGMGSAATRAQASSGANEGSTASTSK